MRVFTDRDEYKLDVDEAGVSWLVRGSERFRPMEVGPLFDLLLELEFEHKYGDYIVVSAPQAPAVSAAPLFVYREYLQSSEWRKRVRAVKIRDDWKCRDCGVRTLRFEVHHLHYENIGNEPLEDLVLLCRSCHLTRHGIDVADVAAAPSVSFDFGLGVS